MDYQETLEYLFRQLPMFQRIGAAAYKANLNNSFELDNYFGHPHKLFKSIHIAGTNGKGSVSHILAAVIQNAGYKTGLYTSPHLKDFRERIKINGIEIPEQYIIDFVEKHRVAFGPIMPSFFELTMAMAFKYFADENVDVALIETGLGGRLDSTNIITPVLSVITNISKDHTQFLGDTLRLIAGEKAGIVKNSIPVVIGETQAEVLDVFVSKAVLEKSPLYIADQVFQIDYALNSIDEKQVFQVYKHSNLVYPNLKLDLLGLYQKKNVMTILQAIDILNNKGFKIENEAIYSGFENATKITGFKGRWQTIGHNPRIICDTGHNEAGIAEIVKQIETIPYKKLHIVFGVVEDKNIDAILEMMPKNAGYYFTKANIPRALDEKLLMQKAGLKGLRGDCYPTVEKALQIAKQNAEKEDFIFIGGSTFVVAEIC
jgi:dihydrofolate synthase/folylpolyglutamate synthase